MTQPVKPVIPIVVLPDLDPGRFVLSFLHSPLCPPLQLEGSQMKFYLAGVLPVRCKNCGDLLSDKEDA